MGELNSTKGSNRLQLWLIGGLAAVAAVAITALLVNIFEHKQEAKNPFYRVVELKDHIEDPAVWGKNFPMQYDGYQRTGDMKQTHFVRSENSMGFHADGECLRVLGDAIDLCRKGQ